MEKTGWKILAIIFISLFVLVSSLVIFSVTYTLNEIDKTNTCYFEVCNGYPEAYYQDNICSCYEYDMWGNDLVLDKQKIIK